MLQLRSQQAPPWECKYQGPTIFRQFYCRAVERQPHSLFIYLCFSNNLHSMCTHTSLSQHNSSNVLDMIVMQMLEEGQTLHHDLFWQGESVSLV